jgi:hypothetical protein
LGRWCLNAFAEVEELGRMGGCECGWLGGCGREKKTCVSFRIGRRVGDTRLHVLAALSCRLELTRGYMRFVGISRGYLQAST